MDDAVDDDPGDDAGAPEDDVLEESGRVGVEEDIDWKAISCRARVVSVDSRLVGDILFLPQPSRFIVVCEVASLQDGS